MMIIRAYIFVLYKIILNCTFHREEKCIICFRRCLCKGAHFNSFESTIPSGTEINDRKKNYNIWRVSSVMC